MPNYDKPVGGSAGDQDKSNAKLFSWIAIAGFVLGHVICYAVSTTPFADIHSHPWKWVLPVLATLSAAWTIKSVLQDKDATELSPWPYILCIVTTFFSCWALFLCTTC